VKIGNGKGSVRSKRPADGRWEARFTAEVDGARDLNPGPHGPEPAWWHVLWCPGGSSSVLLNTVAQLVRFPSCPPVSSRFHESVTRL
jgi:hypothetical protein